MTTGKAYARAVREASDKRVTESARHAGASGIDNHLHTVGVIVFVLLEENYYHDYQDYVFIDVFGTYEQACKYLTDDLGMVGVTFYCVVVPDEHGSGPSEVWKGYTEDNVTTSELSEYVIRARKVSR